MGDRIEHELRHRHHGHRGPWAARFRSPMLPPDDLAAFFKAVPVSAVLDHTGQQVVVVFPPDEVSLVAAMATTWNAELV